MSKYEHRKIESNWQKKWSEDKTFYADINNSKVKFYNLWMFPYPSAEGLHAGHAFASTGSDIYGKFMRMKGMNVFQPIGYDSFGIHTENFAIKINQTPQEMLQRTTSHYEDQLKSLGHGYDWDHVVTTSDADYYRWTQWLFVEQFKAGLAYKKKAFVNWCPGCKTVLADEQIMTPAQAGKIPPGYSNLEDVPEGVKVCERCGNIPERKELSQWFFRITDYADRLLEGHKDIKWSERVVIAQKEWIGKKEGALVKFKVEKTGKDIKVFTTRLDTIFGVSFLVLSPEIADELVDLLDEKHAFVVKKYIKESLNKSEQERKLGEKEKSGVETGLFVINPVNSQKVPVFVADYVLGGVGTGAVMGVPAHDERDYDFAKKHNLSILYVVEANGSKKEDRAVKEKGILINSEGYNGLTSDIAAEKLLKDFPEVFEKSSTYHLRDWLISRQRYWGPPIPMIYCEKCAHDQKGFIGEEKDGLLHKDQSDWDHYGWYPEETLPVVLPEIKEYKPQGEGKGPLANFPEFYETKCPHCGGKAIRETDVSDTFVDSAWYFLRYPSVGSISASSAPFDSEITKSWLPVDLYFGGAEHSVLHLMYARFVTMALFDLKHVSFVEPTPNFYAHGLMIKDGAKMSKSRGNVVSPDQYIEKFGADTLRLYLMFMGPMDGFPDFRDTGIEGMHRFTGRLWRLFTQDSEVTPSSEDQEKLLVLTHKTISAVSTEIEGFRYNTAIAKLMEYVNFLESVKSADSNKSVQSQEWKDALNTLARLLAPFAPHISEEIWVNVLKQKFSVHRATWPKHDPKYLSDKNTVIAVQVNGKLRSQVEVSSEDSASKEKVETLARSDSKVTKWLEDESKEVIFVPGKIINFVTKPKA